MDRRDFQTTPARRRHRGDQGIWSGYGRDRARGGGEHAERSQHDRLYAVFLLSARRAWVAAIVVQEPRIPGPRRARTARRVEGIRHGNRGFGGSARARFDRRHALSRAAYASARHREAERGTIGFSHHPRLHGRRQPATQWVAPLSFERTESREYAATPA